MLATALALALGGTPDAQALVTPVAAVVGLVLLSRTVPDPWGVTVRHDHGTERPARWSQVSRYTETPHTFVLLSGAHAPRLRPRRLAHACEALGANHTFQSWRVHVVRETWGRSPDRPFPRFSPVLPLP